MRTLAAMVASTPFARARSSPRPRALLFCALALVAGACRDKATRTEGATAGEALGNALAAGLDGAARSTAPWPCSAEEHAAPANLPAGWTVREGVLAPAAARGAVTVAVIADGGAGDEATRATLARAAARLAPGADLVMSLGGLGRTQDEIAASLAALVGEPYVVLASPGDLEPVTAHRAAVASLAAKGARIVDGSLVRFVDLGAAAIALLPGVRFAEQSPAGAEACGLGDEDVAQTVARLPTFAGLRVVASWAAPRGQNARHARGDLALGERLERGGVSLAIVGEPTGAVGQEGQGRRGESLQVVSAGFADGAPRVPDRGRIPHAAGLRLQLTPTSWRWQRIDLSMQPVP